MTLRPTSTSRSEPQRGMVGVVFGGSGRRNTQAPAGCHRQQRLGESSSQPRASGAADHGDRQSVPERGGGTGRQSQAQGNGGPDRDRRQAPLDRAARQLERARHGLRRTRATSATRNDLSPPLTRRATISGAVQTCIRHKVMRADPGGDALHLALASFHRCDFLVTWNCRHLANANKFGHIRRVNVLMGLFVPVTPLELLGGRDEPESG